MREIKFRAWDKKKKIMKNVGLLSIPLSKEYEFMQFTGLKDKNGKDMYEGDIIRVDNSGIYKTEYQNGAFGLFLNDGRWIQSLHHSEEVFEIVGNIYENPKLIKE